MRNLLRRIRFPRLALRLQWRLTLSYVLVSLATALSIEVLLLFLGCYLGTRGLAPLRVLAYVEQISRDLAPYITADPPNRDAIAEWLSNGKTRQEQNIDLHYSLIMDFAHVPRPVIAVTDADGRVLSCVPEGAFTIEVPLVRQLPERDAQAVRAALQGRRNTDHLAFRAEHGITVTASPILDAGGRQVGAIYVRVHAVTDYLHLLKSVAELVFPIAIVVLISAACAGMLFGHLTARRITRRLQRVMTAANAWRQGDFTARAQDRGGDELGQMAQDLNRMAEELQTLFGLRQELAMREERNRLARDLHDTVKQQVFATVMQIGAAQALLERDPAGTGRHLVEAERLAHQAQFDLGAILRELRLALPAGEGLAVALRGYAADWARQTGIAAEVSGELELRLPPAAEEALFRIVQEALANVRHSGATRAQIELAEEAGRVTLRVTDNGQGFDIASPAAGMGLRNMRERAEMLPQGSFSLNSEPGIGTRITVTYEKEGQAHARSTV